jgi:hypothetical protein
MDRLQRRHAGEGHGVVLLGSPSQVVGRDHHCGMFAFGLGTVSARYAMASASVFSFRPSGNSIGSSKRRDQDTTQLQTTDQTILRCVLRLYASAGGPIWGAQPAREAVMA